MTPQEAARTAVKSLLDGLSDLELRELCIQALRAWHKGVPGELHFQMHGSLGREIVPLLAKRKNVAVGDVNALKEPFHDATHEMWMTGIAEFMWWFVRAGLGIPLSGTVNGYPITFRLTRAGVRFLDATEDHPLLPGFIDRLTTRCPGLPPDVVALLVDARACLDQGLMRPAIVLMGVAYEIAIEATVQSLITKTALAGAVLDQSAAKRISAVKAVINTVLPGTTSQEKDDQFAAHAAYQFADALRRRRNDASHTTPTYGFEDREEAEELLVSAGRHLPNLWSVR